MNDIDFLPIEYRERRRRRQSQPWQVVAAVALLGMVAGAAFTQQRRQNQLEAEWAAVTPLYESAVQLQKQLADAQERLTEATASAELYTYLRHPWPRTQLLAALVNLLPQEITLQQVQILRDAAPTNPSKNQTAAAKTEEEEKLKLAPASKRDLAALRQRLDSMQTVVILTGMATDSAALHRYLAQLDATDIFDKADLDSFNSVEGNKGNPVLQFRVVLVVQPGYGQPGGPSGHYQKFPREASEGKPEDADVEKDSRLTARAAASTQPTAKRGS